MAGGKGMMKVVGLACSPGLMRDTREHKSRLITSKIVPQDVLGTSLILFYLYLFLLAMYFLLFGSLVSNISVWE